MNDVILSLDGFEDNKVYYGDTDSVYIHENDYNIFKDKVLVGKNLFQSKNDYGENAGIVYGFTSSSKSQILHSNQRMWNLITKDYIQRI